MSRAARGSFSSGGERFFVRCSISLLNPATESSLCHFPRISISVGLELNFPRSFLPKRSFTPTVATGLERPRLSALSTSLSSHRYSFLHKLGNPKTLQLLFYDFPSIWNNAPFWKPFVGLKWLIGDKKRNGQTTQKTHG